MTDKLRFDSPSRLRGFSWIHRDVEKCYSELLTARAKILAMSSVNDHTDRQFYIRGRQSEANRLAQHAREIINFFNETPYFEKPKDAANHAHIDLDPAIESPADITSGDVDAAIDTAIVTMRTEYVRLLRLQQKCAVETPKPRVPLWVRRAAIIVVAIAALALVVMGVIQLVPSFFYNQGVNAVADARLLSNQARQEVAEQSRQAEQAEATKAATESVATVEAAEAATESVSVAVDPWIEAYQRWEQAIAAFTIVHSFTPYTALFGPYQDARMQLADTYEEVFRIRVENRDWDAAIELAARFMDAKVDEQRARQAVRDSYYLPANELFQHKDYPGVRALLDRMPLAGEGLDFEAETLYQDSYYQQAEDASQQTPPDWMQVEDLLTALLERPGGNQRMNAVALLSTSYITRAQGAIDSAHWDDARAVLELMRVAPFSTLPSPRYEEALDLYRSTYYQPGSVLLQSGDYESARSLFDGLLKLPEGIGAYFDTGALYCQTFYGAANTYFTSGQYDEARATLIDFRTDEAEFAAQCDILGLLRQAYFVPAAEAVRAGAWLEALGLLEPLYALKPDDGNTRALLIQTYFTLGQRAVDEGDLAAAQGYLETMRAKRFEVSGLETLLAQVYYNRAQQVLTASADVSRWEDARAFLIPLFNLNHSYRDTETLLRESYYVPFNDQIQRGLIGYNGDLCVQAREAMETDDMQALLADYKDTATLIHETYYCEVQVAIHDGDMDAARESLDRLSALSPNFRDIESLYNQTYYLPALAAMQAGEWQQARRLWSPLLARERFYADAFIQLRESYYLPAKQAFDQRQWDVVRRELIPLIYGTAAEPALDPNYKDAFDLLRESYYLPGAEAFESSSWDAARTALKPLIFAIDTPTPIDPDYKDAFDLLRESYYQPAMQAFNQRAWEVVRHQLEPLLFATNGLPAVDSEYHDSRTLWYVSYYNQAVDALQSQQWETARQLLTSLDQQNPNYPGVQTLLRETYYRPAKLALEAEQWESAREYLRPLVGDDETPGLDPDYEDAQTLLRETYYRPAKLAFDTQDWETARVNLRPLLALDENYLDVQVLLNDSYYIPGKAALDAQNWKAARDNLGELVRMASDHRDGTLLYYWAYFLPGRYALQNGDWGLARGLLQSAMAAAPDDVRRDRARHLYLAAYYRPGMQAVADQDWATARMYLSALLDSNYRGAAELYRDTFIAPIQLATERGDLVAARQALTEFRQAFSRVEDVVTYRELLLNTYSAPLRESIQLGDWLSAAEQYLLLRAENPDDSSIDLVVVEYPELRAALIREFTPLWANVQLNQYDVQFRVSTTPVSGLALNASGLMLITGSSEGLIQIWNTPGMIVARASPKLQLWTSDQWVSSMVLDPRGSWLASSGDGAAIRIWDVQGGQLWRTLTEHTDSVTSLAVSADGLWLASGGDDRTVRLWSSYDWDAPPTVLEQTDRVSALAFSPEGTRLAVALADGHVDVWNLATRAVEVSTSPTAYITEILFHPSGAYFVTVGNESDIHLWSVDAEPLGTLVEHEDWVRSAAFTNDGTLLATVSADNRLVLWNMETREVANSIPLLVQATPLDPARVQFSLDGGQLVVAGYDGEVMLWSVHALAQANMEARR